MQTQNLTFHNVVGALAIVLAATVGLAADIQWSGGGTNFNFDNPDNWVGGGVPGVGDTALFTNSGTHFAQLSANHTVAGLVLGNGAAASATVNTSFRKLTVNGPITVADGSTLLIDGGHVTGIGDHTIEGTLDWKGGFLSGTGTTTILGNLDADDSGSKNLKDRFLVLAGDGILAGGGALDLDSSLSINSTATLTIPDDTDVTGLGTVTVNGIYEKTGGGGTSTMNPLFTNHGTVSSASGTLEVKLGDSSTGSWLTESGCSLELGAGVIVEPTGSVSGDGDVVVDGHVTVYGAWSVSGEVTVSLTGSKQLEFSGPGPYSLPTLTLTSGGSLGGSADVFVTDSFIWESGILRSGGTLTIEPGTNTAINFASAGNLARELIIAGNATIDGAILYLVENGRITVAAGGAFEIFDGTTFTGSTHNGTATITNFGTIVRGVGSSISLLNDVLLENYGLMQLDDGGWETRIGGQYVQAAGETVLAGGTLVTTQTDFPVLVTGGVLWGEGTIDGDLQTTDGKIAPGSPPGAVTVTPGVVTVNGGFTQLTGVGGLDIDAAGLIPVVEYDQLVVIGDSDLSAGRVTLRAWPPWTPAVGDMLDVIAGFGLVSDAAAVAVEGFPPCIDADAFPGIDVLTVEVVGPIFCDGFESGGTAAWSTS